MNPGSLDLEPKLFNILYWLYPFCYSENKWGGRNLPIFDSQGNKKLVRDNKGQEKKTILKDDIAVHLLDPQN